MARMSKLVLNWAHFSSFLRLLIPKSENFNLKIRPPHLNLNPLNKVIYLFN